MNLKIGIIHIQSGIYPLASYDFADAITEGLTKEGFDVELFTEDAESGTNPKLLSEKALKLFRINKVEAIFTLAENNSIVESLETMVTWIKKPVFIASIGARLGTPPTPSGYIYFHELDAWKSAWAVGREMATHYKPLTHLTALYEAGYQLIYGLTKGIAKVENTQSPAFYILQKPMEAEEIAKMLDKIVEYEPKAIFLCMSYKEGANVLSAYSQSQWKDTPLFLSPFVLNEHVNLSVLENISELYEISAIDYDKMKTRTFDTVEINYFSLLGFEAGSILGQKRKQTEAQDIVVDSPRGEIILVKDAFRIKSNQYLYKISVENGELKRTLQKTISDLPDIEALFDGEQNVTFSQWSNPYLFA